MSIHKVTPFLSEIKKFFKNSDMTDAMSHISSTLSDMKMTEKSVLGVESKRNCIYKLLGIFQCLLLFPCFSIKNVFSFKGSGLTQLMKARKDVFYRFLNDPDVDWRKAMWKITTQLWTKVIVRSDHHDEDVCLVLDDTDFNKTGRSIEKVGRVHSHLEHKSVLGFKCLCMTVTDGISQMLLDFDLVGEKGKKENYGLSAKEQKKRHVTTHDSKVLKAREDAYDCSKIALAKEMIRRAISHGLRFKYVLADSWFTCKELVKFIQGRHNGCHWLGMIKVGEKGKTRYCVDRKELTAPELVKKGKKEKKMKYSRKLRCHYITFDGSFGGVKVRIFLVRRTKHGQWNGLLTTDLSLDIFKAWKIYSRRWSIEVTIKDCKTYLGFGKCQSTTFAQQIAATALCCLQYNILSVARRFSDYETIGGIFREVSRETIQLSVAQQIWEHMQELVEAIADLLDLLDEEIYDLLINRSDKLAHVIKIYNMKSAS